MSKPAKVALGIILFICCMLPTSYSIYGLVRQAIIGPDLLDMTVTAGSLEVIVPRARKPDDVFVSPTGRWLALSTEDTKHWFVMDTQTGQEQPLEMANFYADLRWINEEEFVVGNRIVKATDLSVRKLETLSHHEHKNEVVRGQLDGGCAGALARGRCRCRHHDSSAIPGQSTESTK